MPDRDLPAIEIRRAKAYARLGVTPQQVAAVPSISPLLRRLPHGEADAIRILRASPADEARKFFLSYDDRTLSRSARALLPIEAFCVASSVPPDRLLEIIVSSGRQQSVDLGSMLASLAHPEMVEKCIALAKSGNYKALETMLKHMTFLPMPKSAQVNVSVNATAQALAAAPSAAPRPEDMTRRLAQRFNAMPAESAQPQLPATIDAEVVPSEMPRAADADDAADEIVYAERISPSKDGHV